MTDTTSKSLVKEVLDRVKMGVVSTVNKEGHPQSALVYFYADDNFNIYFATFSNSRKYANLGGNKMVAFNVSDVEDPRTVQLEGVAEEVKKNVNAMEVLERLSQILGINNDYFAPLTQIGEIGTVVIRIKPTYIRLGDFAFIPIDGVKEDLFHTVVMKEEGK